MGGACSLASQFIRIPFIIDTDKCGSKFLMAPGSGVWEEEEGFEGAYNLPDFEAHN